MSPVSAAERAATRLRVAASLATRSGAAGRWLDLGLRIAAVLLLVEQLWAVAFIQHPGLRQPEAVGSDPWNYYAAGLRLNVGHHLYGPLSAGDLPVPGYPAIYSAPLLSPPLVAVAWRGLATLPVDVATWTWWAGGILLTIVVTLWLAARGRRRHLLILVGVLLLGLPLAYLRRAHDPYLGFDAPVAIGALSGNINVLVTALLVLSWWALAHTSGTRSRRGRDGLSGVSMALAGALKLTPLTGFVWLAALRAWREVRVGAAALVVLGLVGLAGAGLAANVDYLRITLRGDVRPTDLSLPGLASLWLHVSATGRARYLTLVAIPAGLAATWLLRAHPRASFAAAILTSIWGSPVVYPGNFMLLLALAAPWDLGLPPAREAAGPVLPEAPEG